MQVKSMQDKNTIEQLKSIVADRETKLKQMEQEGRANSVMNSSAFLLNNFKSGDDGKKEEESRLKSAISEVKAETPSLLDREMASSR